MKTKHVMSLTLGVAGIVGILLFPPLYFISDQDQRVSSDHYVFIGAFGFSDFETMVDVGRMVLEAGLLVVAVVLAFVFSRLLRKRGSSSTRRIIAEP